MGPLISNIKPGVVALLVIPATEEKDFAVQGLQQKHKTRPEK
jgi:hypothetical protein